MMSQGPAAVWDHGSLDSLLTGSCRGSEPGGGVSGGLVPVQEQSSPPRRGLGGI